MLEPDGQNHHGKLPECLSLSQVVYVHVLGLSLTALPGGDRQTTSVRRLHGTIVDDPSSSSPYLGISMFIKAKTLPMLTFVPSAGVDNQDIQRAPSERGRRSPSPRSTRLSFPKNRSTPELAHVGTEKTRIRFSLDVEAAAAAAAECDMSRLVRRYLASEGHIKGWLCLPCLGMTVVADG